MQSALVLSGGGALGAAHLGILQVLEEEGYEFDFYAGVSAGAIVASLLALGKNSSELIEILKSTKILSLLFDLSSSFRGIIKGKKLKELLDRLYEGRSFGDLPVPLYIGVTDFSNGENLLLNSGSLADAVRASVSVPLVFEPFFHPGLERVLVDGGLTQNLPLEVAIRVYKGDRIISCDVCSSVRPLTGMRPSGLVKRVKGLKDAAERSLRIAFRSQQRNIPYDPRVIRIAPDLADFNGADVRSIAKIMKIGKDSASEMRSLLRSNTRPRDGSSQ